MYRLFTVEEMRAIEGSEKPAKFGTKEFCVGRRATDEEFAEDGGEGFDDLTPVGKSVRG